MPIKYDYYYKLQDFLELDPRLIPSGLLYNFDSGKLYAAIMDRLAQPLADGLDSPFSSRNPLSGHGQLVGMLVHLLELVAHEMNLIPNRTFVEELRMLGVQIAEAEYPVISLKFKRSNDAFVSNLKAVVPLGTEVYSKIDPNLRATTINTIEINGNDKEVDVPARLNIKGKLISPPRNDEYTVLPHFLSYIDSVTNTEVIYEGQDPETIEQAALRGRQQIQIGKRCTTARDYYYTALKSGATKAYFMQGRQYPTDEYHSDLVSLIVYPPGIESLVKEVILDMAMAGTRVDVIPAQVIPINGEIDVRIVPSLTNGEAFDIAAQAISSAVNPPFGKWGDTNFKGTVATALENSPASIYAVPKLNLKNAITDEPLENLTINDWNLLEIQDTITFNWLR